MKKNLIFLYILIILFSVTSCTQDITDQLRDKLGSTYPRLIVDGSITTDTTTHLVRLARSAEYFYNKPLEPVSNAEVTISDGQNTIILTENPDKPGDYLTAPNVYGIPGRTYTLTIRNVDIDNNGQTEEYTATSFLNPLLIVDYINVKVVKKFYQYQYEVRFFGSDDADRKDYYMFRVRRNGVLLTDTLHEISFTDDEFYNGIYVADQPVYTLFPGKKDEHLKINDTITLESCAITKGYFEFLSDAMLEAYGSDPFGGQPANLRTNINDKTKAMGFFAAYSVTRNSAIVRDTVPKVSSHSMH